MCTFLSKETFWPGWSRRYTAVPVDGACITSESGLWMGSEGKEGRSLPPNNTYTFCLRGAKHYNSTMQLRSRMSVIFFLISTNLEKLQPLNHEQNEKHLTRPMYFIVILMMMILFYFFGSPVSHEVVHCVDRAAPWIIQSKSSFHFLDILFSFRNGPYRICIFFLEWNNIYESTLQNIKHYGNGRWHDYYLQRSSGT